MRRAWTSRSGTDIVRARLYTPAVGDSTHMTLYSDRSPLDLATREETDRFVEHLRLGL
jgi:hypothetical protein